MPALQTCKPQRFAGNMGPKLLRSSRVAVILCLLNVLPVLPDLHGGSSEAQPICGNMWSCTTSLASATGTSLTCATEYAGYSDLQTKSSPVLESRFKESTPVPMQDKIRMGISKWPYKKFPGRRKAPLKQACWKLSLSGFLFWLKAWHRTQLCSAGISQRELAASSFWIP